MEEIRIIEKPDWVTWDEIAECIKVSQATNKKKGFDMSFGHYTGDQLRDSVNGGYTFVALNEENKVLATVSLKISRLHSWWCRGKAGFHCMESVLPEYRGTDVYFDLHHQLALKESQLGLKLLWASTHENNKTILRLSAKDGWKKMQYSASGKNCFYYSIIIAKWLQECPYSDRFINFMFWVSKVVVRFLYKPGKVLRFAFWKKNKKKHIYY